MHWAAMKHLVANLKGHPTFKMHYVRWTLGSLDILGCAHGIGIWREGDDLPCDLRRLKANLGLAMTKPTLIREGNTACNTIAVY